MNPFLENINSAIKIIKINEPKNQKLKLSNLKFLLPYMKRHWKKGVIASFLMIIISLFALPTPLLIKYIIDDVIIAKNFRLLNLIILLLIAIQVSKLMLSFLTSYFFNVLNQEVLLTIKNDLFKKILRLPLSFFDVNQTGYIMSRIGEVSHLGVFFSNSAVRFQIAILEFIFCLFVLLFMHWKLTLVSLSILPVYYLFAKYYSSGIRKTSRDLYEKRALLSRQFQESISGMEVIKTYAMEERESEKVRHGQELYKKSAITSNIIYSFLSELLGLLGAIGGLIVLAYGGSEIIRGNFTIGSYIAFTAYLAKLYGPTQIIASINITFQPAISALNRILEIFGLDSDEANEKKNKKISKLKGKIEFKNVSFYYDQKTKKGIKHLSFKINPGEKIGIVGPNGCGKSTILKLILGLYKAKIGNILLDDKDINQLDLSTLRERISVVPQNVFLFNDSIKNNIRYSNPNATEDKILNAAKQVGALKYVMEEEKKDNSVIGELGKKLSCGERQKISIARAILKDSDIIMLDEPVSSLDGVSVEKIQEIINNNFDNKTCIIVSHDMRMNLVLDKIFILNRGELVQINSD